MSSAARSLSLDGVFIPLTTPFTQKNHEIDYQKLKFNLDIYKSVPFAGEIIQPGESVNVFRIFVIFYELLLFLFLCFLLLVIS